jgi:hypothetical protein
LSLRPVLERPHAADLGAFITIDGNANERRPARGRANAFAPASAADRPADNP